MILNVKPNLFITQHKVVRINRAPPHTTRKMIYGNTPEFEWCQLVIVADIKKNRHETEYRSQSTL
jgi:hypothetical protein